jgi:phage repressor protein C with HTH and peptisase S24 domain
LCCQEEKQQEFHVLASEFYLRLIRQRYKTESVKDFAKRIGFTQQALYKWKSGTVPGMDTLKQIAEATGISVEYLATGILPYNEKEPWQSNTEINESASNKYHPHKDPYEYFGQVDKWDGIELCPIGHAQKVPVVGTVEAGGFQAAEDGDYPVGMANEYVYTDSKTNGILALTVSNDSMEPKFQEGDIILINPNIEPKSGDFVVAKYTPDNEATFKQLIIHHRTEKGTLLMEIVLHPLNEKYDDIHVEDPGLLKIVGKVVEKKVFY